jgi:putative ABC transport system permease protein
MLWKKPGFTLAAVITLALGIGANTAIFSVVNAVLLRPLPYPEPERLVMVWEKRIREGSNETFVSPADFRDWQARNQVFENMAASSAILSASGTEMAFSGDGEPERIRLGNVSAAFFEVLGVKPILGRGFLAEEERGLHRVVVVSHAFWQRRFGAERGVIGRTIQLNGEPYEVIGVLPDSFRFPDEKIEAWFPLDFTTGPMRARTAHFLKVFARIKRGVTLEQAHTEMERIGAQLEQEHPQDNRGHSPRVVPLQEQWTGEVRRALLMLLAAVGLALLIACVNIANLQLVRAAARQKEMAIRLALGAGRGRIIRQLLTESILLATLGAAAGLLLALWARDALISLLAQDVVRLSGAPLDVRVLGFTLALMFLTGILTGSAAAWQATRLNLNETLKEGGQHSGNARQFVRATLIVAEIALAIVLLAGAGLMLRSLIKLQQVAAGFNAENVLTAHLSLPTAKYPERKEAAIFFRQLLGRLRALPRVKAVGATNLLPLDGGDMSRSLAIEGDESNTQEPARAHPRVVTPGYLQALELRLLNGRLLAEADDGQSPLVVLINETAARRYWPGQQPVGKRLRIQGTEEWREVVGVIGDVKHWGLRESVRPEVYVPWWQIPQWSGNLVVRGEVNASSLASALRREVGELDPHLPLANLRMMEEVVAGSIKEPRSYTLLLALFAGAALLLAAAGIYGVISSAISASTHEIGIRMALGAQRSDVLRLVIGQGMRLTLVGVAVGLAGAFALTRWMENLLFEVEPTDPVTFGAVAVLLTLVALVACLVPARRAAKVDPMVALRYE